MFIRQKYMPFSTICTSIRTHVEERLKIKAINTLNTIKKGFVQWTRCIRWIFFRRTIDNPAKRKGICFVYWNYRLSLYRFFFFSWFHSFTTNVLIWQEKLTFWTTCTRFRTHVKNWLRVDTVYTIRTIKEWCMKRTRDIGWIFYRSSINHPCKWKGISFFILLNHFLSFF